MVLTEEQEQIRDMLRDFRAQKLDLLIGTQMIAKGLDFPNVTLVGVLNADIALNLPDFRAAERTFQLLVQVAGRAGRGEQHGAQQQHHRPQARTLLPLARARLQRLPGLGWLGQQPLHRYAESQARRPQQSSQPRRTAA